MSRKVGLNVSLNLSTQNFSKGLDKAKGEMRKFESDTNRQRQAIRQIGSQSLGSRFGVVSTAAESIAMGGIAGGVAAVLVPLTLMVGAMKALVTGIEAVNGAAANARKTMEALARGDKIERGMLSGFTPLAAQAATATSKITMSEVVASNLKPRGTLEDAFKSYLISAGPNVLKAVFAEDFNIATDILAGRGAGDIRRRYAAASFSALAGDFGTGAAQFAANNLDEARKGNRLVQEQNAILRGN